MPASESPRDAADDLETRLPIPFAVLSLFFQPPERLRRAELLADDRRLPMPAGLLERLARGELEKALELAARALRAHRVLDLPDGLLTTSALPPDRTLAALVVPLSDAAFGPIAWRLRKAFAPEENQPTTDRRD